MSAIVFLVVALGLGMAASAVLVLRSRQPTSSDWSVEEFRREMKALSPELDGSDSAPHRRPGEP